MMVPSLTCFVLSLGFLWPRPRMRPVCWEPGRTERAQTGIEKANQWSLVVVQCQTLSKHCKASHLYQLSTIPKTMQILSMTMIMILVSLTFSSRRITPPLLVPPWKPLLHLSRCAWQDWRSSVSSWIFVADSFLEESSSLLAESESMIQVSDHLPSKKHLKPRWSLMVVLF